MVSNIMTEADVRRYLRQEGIKPVSILNRNGRWMIQVSSMADVASMYVAFGMGIQRVGVVYFLI